MSLTELLRQLVYDSGALGALVMTGDGLPLVEFRSDGLFELPEYAEEFAAIISHVHHVTTLLESGTVEELTVTTDRLRLLVRMLAGGLALLLALPHDGAPGKACYLMRRAGTSMAEVLVKREW